MRTFTLSVHPGLLAICRLPPDAVLPRPSDAVPRPLYAVTRTAEELSVVCAQEDAPAGAIVDAGWRALTLDGPFDLTTEVGVLVAVLLPLAEAQVGTFALSTYDTDHVLVRDVHLGRAVDALRAAGHHVRA